MEILTSENCECDRESARRIDAVGSQLPGIE